MVAHNRLDRDPPKAGGPLNGALRCGAWCGSRRYDDSSPAGKDEGASGRKRSRSTSSPPTIPVAGGTPSPDSRSIRLSCPGVSAPPAMPAVVPVRLVPARADAVAVPLLDPVAPVRRVVPVVRAVVARALVRPEERRPALRFAAVRFAGRRLAVVRLAAVRLAGARLAVERLAVLRLAVLRFAVERLAVLRLAVARFAVERLAVLRLAVERLAVARFAVERFAVERLAVLRLAVARFAVARFAVE